MKKILPVPLRDRIRSVMRELNVSKTHKTVISSEAYEMVSELVKDDVRKLESITGPTPWGL